MLPILGDTLVEVRINTCCLPALFFKAEDESEAELTFEDCITLKSGNEERLLQGSKPGITFNPKGLAPLLELLGSQVTDAMAEKNGHLRVTFSNKIVLSVRSSDGYEAWHFQYPRSGRVIGSNVDRFVSLTGADGHLV